MAIFGYQVIGTLGTNRNIINSIVGSVFNCPVPGTANSITAYLQMGGTAGRNVKCAIYKHSDLSLVKATSQRADIAFATPGWYTFTFPGGDPVLTAGDYILVAWGNAGGAPNFGNMYWDDGNGPDPGNQGHYQDIGYDGFPDPLVLTGHEDREYSIYCTYTPAPGWTGKISGIINPAKIMGIDVASIATVNGVA